MTDQPTGGQPATGESAEQCDWCGNGGHTAGAHPLPQSHPLFNPELDDNPVMDLALPAFLDFVARQDAEQGRSAADRPRS
jgi:hypothetical protein